MAETDLIQQIKAREDSAFRDLRKMGLELSRKYVHLEKVNHYDERWKDMEDIIQEGIIHLWAKLQEGVKINTSLKSYFSGILRHLWMRKWSKDKRWRQFMKEEVMGLKLSNDQMMGLFNYESWYRILNDIYEKMRADKKEDCVELIHDRYYSEMRDRDTAEEMNLKQKSIKVMRHRCMNYLKSYLKEHPQYLESLEA